MNAPNQTDPPAFKFFFAVIVIVLASFLVAVTVTGSITVDAADSVTNSWGLISTNLDAHTNLQLNTAPTGADVFWKNYFRTNHPVRVSANPTNQNQ